MSLINFFTGEKFNTLGDGLLLITKPLFETSN